MRIRDWSSDGCSSQHPRNTPPARAKGQEATPIAPPKAAAPAKAKKAGRAIAEAEAATSIAPTCTAVKESKKKRPSGPAVAANVAAELASVPRSAERRGGKKCGSSCNYRWAPDT